MLFSLICLTVSFYIHPTFTDDDDDYDDNANIGTLISGTHCSRIFSDCDTNICRLQSPNYPGVYPRNLTCYYAVRQVRRIEFHIYCLTRRHIYFYWPFVPWHGTVNLFALEFENKMKKKKNRRGYERNHNHVLIQKP